MTEAQRRWMRKLADGAVIGPNRRLFERRDAAGRLGRQIALLTRPTFDVLMGNGWIATGSWGEEITSAGREALERGAR